VYICKSVFENVCDFSGVGDVRPDERYILHRGRVFRFVLFDQLDAGCGRVELRRRSGNHARGMLAN